MADALLTKLEEHSRGWGTDTEKRRAAKEAVDRIEELMAGQIMRLALHCRKCMEELPANTSLKEYARHQVGLTTNGEIAVWCNRHDMKIGTVTIGGIIDPMLLAAKCECCEGGVHGGAKSKV